MNPILLLSLSFEALRERRLRASLTILMVVMGASLIVALDGTGNGFTEFVNAQFSLMGANVLILQPRGGNIDLDKPMVNALTRIKGVKDAVPYIQEIAPIKSRGRTQTVVVVGIDQSKLPLLFPTISMEVGEFVSETDNIGILLGSEIVQISEGAGAFAGLGQTVTITYQRYMGNRPMTSERSFSVRGVLKTVGSGIVPVDQMAFISTSTANSFFNRGSEYDGIYVITEDPELNDLVRQAIRDRYGGDLIIISPQTISSVINQVRSGIYFFISIVAYVSLLVASVGIITTLHTSMMERIKEIGLLKALGFNNHLVLTLFLAEAILIGVIGASIGILSGMGLSYFMSFIVGRALQTDSFIRGSMIYSFTLEINPLFSPINLISTWVICVVLSMISGFYPAWRASRMDPVVALRHE